MKIVIESIPHHQQRYPTAGDYWTDADGTKHIKVSQMGCWRKQTLLAIHELIESALCDHAGISEDAITDFDVVWEQLRSAGHPMESGEPGNDPKAPYRKQHEFALAIESLVADKLGVDWIDYNRTLDAL